MRVNWQVFKHCKIMYYSNPKDDKELDEMKRGNLLIYNSLWNITGWGLDLCNDEVQSFLSFLRSTFEPEYSSNETYKPTVWDKIYHRIFHKGE